MRSFYLASFYIFLIILVTACEIEKPDIPTGEYNKEAEDFTLSSPRILRITDESVEVVGDFTFSIKNKVTAWGFCWGNTSEPTLSDLSIELGETDNSTIIHDLSRESDYYISAYATNILGATKYSDPIHFTWRKSEETFGGNAEDVIMSVCPTSDGGYIIASFCASTDLSGHTPSSRKMESVNRDIWVIKFAEDGSEQWQKFYGGTDHDSPFEIKEIPGEGYILVGYTDSEDGLITEPKGGRDGFVVKIDYSGEVLERRNIGGRLLDEIRSVIVQKPENKFVISGVTESPDGDMYVNNGYGDIFFMGLSNDLQPEWVKIYGTSYHEEIFCLKEEANGDFIAAGTMNQKGLTVQYFGGSDMIVMEISASSPHDINWAKNYGGTDDEEVKSFDMLPGGDFVVTGYSYSSDYTLAIAGNKGEEDFFIFRIDPETEGIPSWRKSFGGNDSDNPRSVFVDSNGDIYVGGTTKSTDIELKPVIGTTDGYLIKLNPAGEQIWHERYGATNATSIKCINQLNNGDIIVCGSIDDGTADRQCWVLKF